VRAAVVEDSRVVDEHVQVAELRFDPRVELIDALLVSHIELQRMYCAGSVCSFGREVLGPGELMSHCGPSARITAAQHNDEAVTRELATNFQADAPIAARDQGNAQLLAHTTPSRSR
jgi:hypothetical protein